MTGVRYAVLIKPPIISTVFYYFYFVTPFKVSKSICECILQRKKRRIGKGEVVGKRMGGRN